MVDEGNLKCEAIDGSTAIFQIFEEVLDIGFREAEQPKEAAMGLGRAALEETVEAPVVAFVDSRRLPQFLERMEDALRPLEASIAFHHVEDEPLSRRAIFSHDRGFSPDLLSSKS